MRSVGHALRGIAALLRSQHNAWVHAAATIAVCGLGLVLGVGAADWLWLVFAITLVWMAEAFNTALELACDAASPEFHPLVGRAKDVAAGAVLIGALGATVVGCLVFLPYLADHLRG